MKPRSLTHKNVVSNLIEVNPPHACEPSLSTRAERSTRSAGTIGLTCWASLFSKILCRSMVAQVRQQSIYSCMTPRRLSTVFTRTRAFSSGRCKYYGGLEKPTTADTGLTYLPAGDPTYPPAGAHSLAQL